MRMQQGPAVLMHSMNTLQGLEECLVHLPRCDRLCNAGIQLIVLLKSLHDVVLPLRYAQLVQKSLCTADERRWSRLPVANYTFHLFTDALHAR